MRTGPKVSRERKPHSRNPILTAHGNPNRSIQSWCTTARYTYCRRGYSHRVSCDTGIVEESKWTICEQPLRQTFTVGPSYSRKWGFQWTRSKPTWWKWIAEVFLLPTVFFSRSSRVTNRYEEFLISRNKKTKVTILSGSLSLCFVLHSRKLDAHGS